MRSPIGLVCFLSVTLCATAADKIRLEGAPNFRDVGGYSTADGKKIKQGLVFRSGQLAGLTDADQKLLAGLHIQYIYDLRTDKERETSPTKWQGSRPQILELSLGQRRDADPTGMINQMLNGVTTPEQAKAAMSVATARMAIDGAAVIGQILRSLGEGHSPAIIHCTAGKDRTGVTTAILLTTLGVPRQTVFADYLRSNEAMAIESRRNGKGAANNPAYAQTLAKFSPQVLGALMSVEPGYMQAVFEGIERKYGSFNRYVRDGLGLSDADIQALRSRLLE